MAWAISRTVTPLGFSLETVLCIKLNASREPAARSRSVGLTRVPARPMTIRSPFWTSDMGTHSAVFWSGFTRMPQSISCLATGIHSPPKRISVSWLVVA